ncbi:hypothetical protein [Nocardia coffeae]|nr:hypothetical protein [Nocardia coffeae]
MISFDGDRFLGLQQCLYRTADQAFLDRVVVMYLGQFSGAFNGR